MRRSTRMSRPTLSGSSRSAVLLGNDGDGSTLTLDFTKGVLDSRFTFTRGSGSNFPAGTGPSYVGSDGFLKYATTNQARFDHDPTTFAARGLLIEADTTNLTRSSTNLTNTAIWTLQTAYAATSATADTAPDNTFTGNSFTEPNSNQQRSIYQTYASAAGTYTFSVWAKPGSGSVRLIRLVVSSASGDFGYATFNLSTGAIEQAATAVGTATNASLTVSGLYTATGWRRYSLTVTLAATVNFGFIVPMDLASMDVPTTNFGRVAYHGDGSSFLLWGAMMESGAGPSSFVSTGASTATRVADFAVMSDISAVNFNTSGGTMTVNGFQTKRSAGSFPSIIGFLDASDVPVLGVLNTTLGTTLIGRWANGATSAEQSRNITNNALYKFGVVSDPGLSVGAVTVSINGSSATGNKTGAGTTIAVPTKFAITRPGFGAFINCGTISQIKYWPTAKTDSELNVLTT